MVSHNQFLWGLEIDAEPVDAGLANLISSVEVNITRDRMSKVTLSLESPLVADNTKTRYIFSKGRLVKVFAGYDKLKFIGAGVIDHHDLQCADESLLVHCLDKGGMMGLAEHDEVYTNTKDSDIVSTIAKKYDLTLDMDTTQAKVSRTQQNKTDYAFVRTLAANNGYEFFIEYDYHKAVWVLHFHKPRPNKQKTSFEFEYSATKDNDVVKSFSPRVYGKLQKKGKLIVHAWLSDTRQDTTLEEKTLGEDETVEEIFDKRFQNKQEAEQFIKGLAKTRDEAYMEASAVLLGNPELFVGDIHTFKGLTFMFFPSLDGDYRVKEVTHRIVPQETFNTELNLLRSSS